MARFLCVLIAILFVQSCPAEAADQNCMNDYYRTKRPDCVDSILSQLRQAPRSGSDPATAIGFLAQLFVVSPGERQRILNDEPSEYIRSMDLVALYRAGLLDDARKFADKIDRSRLLQKLETDQLKYLAAVRPSSTPADNDLLIGAYMASGDTVFIERILQNFSSADDGAVSDALRMGYMNSKFGPNLTPKGRENVMAPAGCAKYQCKTDPTKFLRVLTLSSAFWALQSLAQQDEGIKTTFAGFFERDKRFKNLRAAEQAAFGNYLTALIVIVPLKDSHSSTGADQAYAAMSKAASAYENLEPASTVFGHIEALTESGTKSK
jgi:hypothetical protein